MKDINVGLIGLGTIGKGVYEALLSNCDILSKRTGLNIAVTAVCEKDKNAIKAVNPDKSVKVLSLEEIVKAEDVDVIVELMGGINPAKEVLINALKNKKHVVTANKALLSDHSKEIFTVAEENNRVVCFEASVGGAIPVIRVLRESFVANNIDTIYGILNGTTNYILSEMADKAYSFEKALKIAQEKGIAEKDPDLDVSGKDSAHKLAILSILGFGSQVCSEDIYTEGIESLSPQDIDNAKKWGYSVKLLAIAKNTSKGLQLRVHPTLLPVTHLLSDVNEADNAVFIKGDLIGESLLFGKGAGSKPTASSVIADIVSAGKIISSGEKNTDEKMVYSSQEFNLDKIEDLEVSFYLRFSVIDKPGVLAGISSVLAKNDISIANVAQEERNMGETVPVIILTHMAKEGDMKKAVEEINKLDCISADTVVIRIEE